MARIYRIKNKC